MRQTFWVPIIMSLIAVMAIMADRAEAETHYTSYSEVYASVRIGPQQHKGDENSIVAIYPANDPKLSLYSCYTAIKQHMKEFPLSTLECRKLSITSEMKFIP